MCVSVFVCTCLVVCFGLSFLFLLVVGRWLLVVARWLFVEGWFLIGNCLFSVFVPAFVCCTDSPTPFLLPRNISY